MWYIFQNFEKPYFRTALQRKTGITGIQAYFVVKRIFGKYVPDVC